MPGEKKVVGDKGQGWFKQSDYCVIPSLHSEGEQGRDLTKPLKLLGSCRETSVARALPAPSTSQAVQSHRTVPLSFAFSEPGRDDTFQCLMFLCWLALTLRQSKSSRIQRIFSSRCVIPSLHSEGEQGRDLTKPLKLLGSCQDIPVQCSQHFRPRLRPRQSNRIVRSLSRSLSANQVGMTRPQLNNFCVG